MMLNDVTKEVGGHRRPRRVGRGRSSGRGKTCGRGHKGCRSRSGGGTRPLHEGGQMPIFRRLPKRGFSNYEFRTEYVVVNLSRLDAGFESGATVDPKALAERGLIGSVRAPLKVLGKGALTKKLTVNAHAFSKAAREAIEKAGGTALLIERRDPAELARAKRGSRRKEAGPRHSKSQATAPAAPSDEPPAVEEPQSADQPSADSAGETPAEEQTE